MPRLKSVCAGVAIAGAMATAVVGCSWTSRPYCTTHAFDHGAWLHARRLTVRDTPAGERTTRRLAAYVVRCRLVDGASKREVRSLLGAPDDLEEVPRAEAKRYWDYEIGSENSDALFLEVAFDARGRVRRTTDDR